MKKKTYLAFFSIQKKTKCDGFEIISFNTTSKKEALKIANTYSEKNSKLSLAGIFKKEDLKNTGANPLKNIPKNSKLIKIGKTRHI